MSKSGTGVRSSEVAREGVRAWRTKGAARKEQTVRMAWGRSWLAKLSRGLLRWVWRRQCPPPAAGVRSGRAGGMHCRGPSRLPLLLLLLMLLLLLRRLLCVLHPVFQAEQKLWQGRGGRGLLGHTQG